MPQQLRSLQRACITYCKGTCNHRTLAERSVRTWKNHFIASWATADVACPPPLWATTVEHCELAEPLPPLISQSVYLSMARLHKQRYPFHSRPWAPWDVRFRCSSLQQADLLVSAL
jgi:hypothetical protein